MNLKTSLLSGLVGASALVSLAFPLVTNAGAPPAAQSLIVESKTYTNEPCKEKVRIGKRLYCHNVIGEGAAGSQYRDDTFYTTIGKWTFVYKYSVSFPTSFTTYGGCSKGEAGYRKSWCKDFDQKAYLNRIKAITFQLHQTNIDIMKRELHG